MKTAQWNEPRIVQWSQWLLDSYRHWTGKELIERVDDRSQQAQTLFEASFVVVSHGVEPDPILNYGNQTALDLWEMSWEQFSKTPSRLTAEPDDRTERARMLERAKLYGYFDGYRGVRISSTGRRFLVEQALIWNVIDSAGSLVGQAATFSQWSNLSWSGEKN
ncbi:MAG: MEKHLA domain-containing protein [Nitrospira sp.]|nr:MEKHLA domain-containing protein [Nitrospira sp.]